MAKDWFEEEHEEDLQLEEEAFWKLCRSCETDMSLLRAEKNLIDCACRPRKA
jgi:hypothetical protein